MPDHVFVIMPFGMKDGIDFNKVYDDYIKPALEQQGYEVFRADEALEAGEIREEMFQELLLADLVVADLSIDNPNVWYELGVRHALRSRGIVLIQSQRDKQPFDVYTDRKLRYRIKGDAPDPEFLQRDRESLGEMANNTIASWQGKKISPVYQLLPNLQEPDWKSLRVGGVCEYWELRRHQETPKTGAAEVLDAREIKHQSDGSAADQLPDPGLEGRGRDGVELARDGHHRRGAGCAGLDFHGKGLERTTVPTPSSTPVSSG